MTAVSSERINRSQVSAFVAGFPRRSHLTLILQRKENIRFRDIPSSPPTVGVANLMADLVWV
jgi:hypothetical protein